MTVRQGVVARVGWAAVGTAFSQGSTFLANLLIANQLGRADFGSYMLVLGTMQTATLIAGMGVSYAATKYLAEHRHADPARARAVLRLCRRVLAISSLMSAGVLLVLGSWIARNVLRVPDVELALRVVAIGVVFATWNGLLTGILAGLEEFRTLGRIGIGGGIAYLALCVGGTQIGGVVGGAIGLTASAAAQTAWLAFACYSALRRGGVWGASGVALNGEAFWRFMLPGAIATISAPLSIWIAQAILARSGGGTTQVALYAASANLLTAVLFLPNVLNTVSMAVVNRMKGMRDESGYRRSLDATLRSTLLLAVVGAAVLALLGRKALGLFGPGFDAAYPTLLLLLLATLPEATTIALNQVLQSRERMWDALLGVSLPRDVLMPFLAVLLVPMYGAAGLAAGYLTGRLVACGTTALLVRRIGRQLHG